MVMRRADRTPFDEEPGHEPEHWPDDDDALLDDAFPLGDGVAERDALVHCPYCGEPNEIALDPGSGESQEYVEDCQVCCQPWQVIVQYLPDGRADVTVLAADET